MSEDIEARVRAEFGDDADTAMAVLSTYGEASYHGEIERVRRAILTLAKGDLAELRSATTAACLDYRDVLYWVDLPTDAESVRDRKKKTIELIVWCEFSRDAREPETWDDVQAAIQLPPELLEELGTGGLPTRETLLAMAKDWARAGGEPPG